MMISRVSYLPVVFEWLERLYAKGMDASVDDRLWLSSGSIPLKWYGSIINYVAVFQHNLFHCVYNKSITRVMYIDKVKHV